MSFASKGIPPMPRSTNAPRLPTMPLLPRLAAGATDALLAAAAQPGPAAGALEARPRSLPRPGRRQLLVLALVGIAVFALLAFTRGPAAELTAALERVANADL